MKKQTEQFLLAGIFAGPFYFFASLLHGLIHPGFDIIRHPASLLSVGQWGWAQIVIFVITGICYIACAIGLKRVLKSGIGSRFVAPLFMVLGGAMIAGGVFTADPAMGFPPGTPPGVPSDMSWHAALHGLAPVVGFSALLIALIILGRRFGRAGEKSLMWGTILVAIATWILSGMSSFTGNWETGEFNFLPLWAGVALGFGYTSFILWKVKQEWVKK